MPIRVSAVDSELPLQKVNDEIMIAGTLTQHITLCLILIEAGSLTEICKSGDNGNEDSDDSEFPPVPEIGSHYWKEQRGKRGLRVRI
jgi:hypothetical protein